ncbi:hypothetical protein I5M32_00890 [Pedobacter sp. SD-b]|uniref:Uncharacterized protein n=1 Tax=Pedobacter segetis TaxID=2793069 RepID=A0ABS1BFC1_9SPHI|nr:hypothetical protein [Pedobacter segetis]MBK0381501.1 hypothetical protein [Pedobacter segetis]
MDKKRILAYALIILAIADIIYWVFVPPTLLAYLNNAYNHLSVERFDGGDYKLGYYIGLGAKPIFHIVFIALCLIFGFRSRVKEEYNEEHKS